MTSYIKFNNNTVDFLLNKMKIKIFLEIMNFIDTDDNINDFLILSILFNERIKKFIKHYYVCNYHVRINNDVNNINNIITYVYDNLFDNSNILSDYNFSALDNIASAKTIDDFINLIPENKKQIAETTRITKYDALNISEYLKIVENFEEDNLDKFEYILFILLYQYPELSINTNDVYTLYIQNYIDKSLKLHDYYIELFKSYLYGYKYLKFLIESSSEEDKIFLDKIKLDIKKLIKYIFLTNYIDINYTYAIYCINIYLYEINQINQINKDDINYKANKSRIIITLLARLLLQTNTFYLNNYTNYLNIKFSIQENKIPYISELLTNENIQDLIIKKCKINNDIIKYIIITYPYLTYDKNFLSHFNESNIKYIIKDENKITDKITDNDYINIILIII